MMLDWFDHVRQVPESASFFQTQVVPFMEGTMQYYDHHFNRTEGGKLDIYPAQALETWQCQSYPPTRADCVTNPMPEVAGLRAVLARALALPPDVIRPVLRQQWQRLFESVPAIPISSGNVTLLVAGDLLPKAASNSENPELYAIHPYRLVTWLRQRDLGLDSYAARTNRGNTGWSQDHMTAALLGLASEAGQMAVERAARAPDPGYRFPTFTSGIGAGGPITDHGGVYLAGLRFMLMQFDAGTIFVFPAWPCEWPVAFRLHAPNATVVTVDYEGPGKLSIQVQPDSETQNVHVVQCG